MLSKSSTAAKRKLEGSPPVLIQMPQHFHSAVEAEPVFAGRQIRTHVLVGVLTLSGLSSSVLVLVLVPAAAAVEAEQLRLALLCTLLIPPSVFLRDPFPYRLCSFLVPSVPDPFLSLCSVEVHAPALLYVLYVLPIRLVKFPSQEGSLKVSC